jgi:hypothetical protein
MIRSILYLIQLLSEMSRKSTNATTAVIARTIVTINKKFFAKIQKNDLYAIGRFFCLIAQSIG